MSVQQYLGLENDSDAGVVATCEGWHRWCAEQPDLQVVDEFANLRAWTYTKDPRVNDVLRGLVWWGSPSGGDDLAAVTAVCSLLMGGAVGIARSMADCSAEVDQVVASHLWSVVREFDWTKPTGSVAGSILRQTRRSVQAEFGVGEGARRAGMTRTVVCLDPNAGVWESLVEPEVVVLDPAEELLELLDSATAAGVLGASDRDLLVDLALVAAEHQRDRGAPLRGRGCGGLLTRAAKDEVAAMHGMSARTVGRHAARALEQLASFASSNAAVAA